MGSYTLTDCDCCQCCGAGNEPTLFVHLEGCPGGDVIIELTNDGFGSWSNDNWNCETTCSFDVTLFCASGPDEEWTIEIAKDEGVADCNHCNISSTAAESVTCQPLEIDFGMHFMGCDCCDADAEVHVYVTI